MPRDIREGNRGGARIASQSHSLNDETHSCNSSDFRHAVCIRMTPPQQVLSFRQPADLPLRWRIKKYFQYFHVRKPDIHWSDTYGRHYNQICDFLIIAHTLSVA